MKGLDWGSVGARYHCLIRLETELSILVLPTNIRLVWKNQLETPAY
jgi:hypothetical protein